MAEVVPAAVSEFGTLYPRRAQKIDRHVEGGSAMYRTCSPPSTLFPCHVVANFADGVL